MSRPPSVSTSAKVSSLRRRRSPSDQTHSCNGRINRSSGAVRATPDTAPRNDLAWMFLVRPSVTGAVTVVGLGLVAAAAATNQSWLDRHFLPSFFVPRQWYVAIESFIRIAIAAIGLILVLARAHVARLFTRQPLLVAQAIGAAVLAIAAAAITI